MATTYNSILGTFVGRVGPITGYMRNGRNVIRISKSSVTDKPTPARLAQREKMRLCNAFTSAFNGTGFFKRTFPSAAGGGSGLNRASGAVLNLAIGGIYPALSINFSKVLVSNGRIPPATEAQAMKQSDTAIFFSWQDNNDLGTASKKDKAVLVAFSPATGKAIFSIGHAVRGDGQALLHIPSAMNDTYHTWLGFINQGETEAATSIYTGMILLK